MKMIFKKRIQKNTSFRQFYTTDCSCESIEFSVSFVTNTLNKNIKFEVSIKIDSQQFFCLRRFYFEVCYLNVKK